MKFKILGEESNQLREQEGSKEEKGSSHTCRRGSGRKHVRAGGSKRELKVDGGGSPLPHHPFLPLYAES